MRLRQVFIYFRRSLFCVLLGRQCRFARKNFVSLPMALPHRDAMPGIGAWRGTQFRGSKPTTHNKTLAASRYFRNTND